MGFRPGDTFSATHWPRTGFPVRPLAAGPAWTPASLSPLAWWRADLGVTITGAGASQWSDQSGNGYHWLQADNTYRPALDATAINGLPALTFQASVVDHMGLAGITVPGDFTVWAMLKATNGVTANAALIFNVGGTPTVLANDSGDRPSLYYAGNRNPGATAITDGTWRSMRWMRDNTSLYIAYGSGADQTISSGGFGSSGAWTYLATGGGESFDGQIAELLITSAALTAPQIASLNAYRLARYGQ